MVIVSSEPIDPAASYRQLAQQNTGSVVFHYAVVKEQASGNLGTTGMEFHSKGGTEAELEEIAQELKQKWELDDVLLVRRVGKLKLGEVISLVAVSSPNSEDAFASCRHGIGLFKKMKTMAKAETYG